MAPGLGITAGCRFTSMAGYAYCMLDKRCLSTHGQVDTEIPQQGREGCYMVRNSFPVHKRRRIVSRSLAPV